MVEDNAEAPVDYMVETTQMTAPRNVVRTAVVYTATEVSNLVGHATFAEEFNLCGSCYCK